MMKRVPPSNHSISEWNFLNSLRYSSKWQPGALLGVMDWYGIDVDWNSHAGELVLSWFTWDSWDSPVVLQCFRSFVSASHFGRQPFEQWNQMIPGHHLQKNGRFKSLRIWETFLFQYIHPTWPNSYGDVRAAEVFFCFLPWLRLWMWCFISPLCWLTHRFLSRFQKKIKMKLTWRT